MRIPTEVDELVPDWFTAALQTRVPGLEVTSVDVVDAHSGTTGRVRVRLEYALGQPDEPPRALFVKLAPFHVRQREFVRRVGIGVSEARFYASLGSALPVRAPDVWYAGFDDEGRFVMLLEDLIDAGCSFPTPSDPDVADRARSTVEELARLHSAFWESPRFSGDLGWVPERAGFGGGGGRDAGAAAAAGEFVRRAIERFADEMPAAFRRVGTLYVERTADILDLWDEGERTLIHGDPHMGNLFADAGRTGFYDWGMVSHSPALRDVAYFCCNSVPPDVRRALEHDLLRRYREVLAAESGISLEADAAYDQYRLFAVFSWVSATSTAAVGGRWQPEAVGRGGMERATAAVADLDSVGLLEERLGRR